MKKFVIGLAVAMAALLAVFAQTESSNPFLGRWDFNITTPGGNSASWLGVTEKGGKLEIWYQPTGGNVFEVKDFKINGSHLSLSLGRNRPATWELDAKGGELTGVQKQGDATIALTGYARQS